MGIEHPKAQSTFYLIKDLSVRSGHSIHTLNYYLNLGLLREFARTPETNFRIFDDRALERLKRIRALRRQGRSIEDIRRTVAP